MKITLDKPLELEGKQIKELNLKLDQLTGSDILKIDNELRQDGDIRGFDNINNQKILLTLASKSCGILPDDLERLSVPDFLEVTFTVRNFLMGLLDPTEVAENSDPSSSS
ncbi:phage tail assembly protein [Gracilibacillus oryzae]|uniref:Phage tail assembly protein n=1 Tax=Gracilibacillus oryzae TaxID=1672701 RepID=A0A7C8KMW1_9BACI|nr:phage tail assembly protein [Gracilibacillus oryzae]KAB8126905.1 phage tail assembly protein [Gracilibacillus oryzae]